MTKNILTPEEIVAIIAEAFDIHYSSIPVLNFSQSETAYLATASIVYANPDAGPIEVQLEAKNEGGLITVFFETIDDDSALNFTFTIFADNASNENIQRYLDHFKKTPHGNLPK